MPCSCEELFERSTNMFPNDLVNFDRLPDAAHVNVTTVAGLYGCTEATIWLRLRKNQIPQPRRFGAHTRWNVGELREALQA